MVIYKYTFTPGEDLLIEVTSSFKVVLAGTQHTAHTVWIEQGLGCGRKLFKRLFRIVGTGETYGPEWSHVASFQEGSFVWHVLVKE